MKQKNKGEFQLKEKNDISDFKNKVNLLSKWISFN